MTLNIQVLTKHGLYYGQKECGAYSETAYILHVSLVMKNVFYMHDFGRTETKRKHVGVNLQESNQN